MLPKRRDITKQADSKGRITLGERFANRAVIIHQIDETAVTVTIARVIPEREAWLYENIEAKKAVFRGLEQARNRQFVNGPDLKADAALSKKMGDDSD